MSNGRHLTELGDEMLAFIMSYLTIEERVRCEQVCRKWRFVLRQLPVRAVCVYTDDHVQPFDAVCLTSSHQPSRQDTIRVTEKRLKQTIHGLFVKYRLINCLVLYCHDTRSLRKQEFFAFMRPYTAQLMHLELNFTYGPFVKEDLMHMNRSWNSTLTHLIIRYRRDRGKIMTEKCIMKLFEPCINLELMCWDSPEIVEQRFEYFPNNLSELHVPSSRISSESVDMLVTSNGEIFQRLTLGTVNGKQFKLICDAMPELRSLRITSLEIEKHLSLLASLSKLETLEFGLSNLVDIDCDEFTTQLSNALRKMHNLHTLHLDNVPIDDTFLKQLPNKCDRLRSLHITCSDQFNAPITPAALNALLLLPELRSVCVPMQSLQPLQALELLQKSKWTHLNICGTIAFEVELMQVMKSKALNNPTIRFEVKIVQNHLEEPSVSPNDSPANLNVIRSIQLVDESYDDFLNENNQNYY
jgi:hypothetical protein